MRLYCKIFPRLMIAAFIFAAILASGCGGSGSGQAVGESKVTVAKAQGKKQMKKKIPSENQEAVKKACLIKAAGIEKLQEWVCMNADGKESKNPQLKRVEIFDKDGLPIEEINYKDDGKIMSRWTYTNEKQRQVDSKFFWENKLETERSTKFDERGRVVETSKKDLDSGGLSVKRFKYNEADEVIEEFEVEKDQRKIITFDSEGREIETSIVRGNGAPRPIARKRYDGAGNLVEIQYPIADGFSCWKFKYDDRGNQTEFRDQDMDGSVEFKLSKYDEKDRLIEETRFKEGEPERTRTTISYDADGRQIGGASFKNDQMTGYFECGYDSTGRLIVRTKKDVAGKVLSKNSLRYGTHGLLEENRTIDAAGKLTDLTRFTAVPRKP